MKISLIGMGCGRDSLTAGAAGAIARAELIVGAARLLAELPEHHAELVPEYRPREILALLKETEAEECCVLYSGDSGFYSGAASLLPLLGDLGAETEVFPGISSLQTLAASMGSPWQDWRLCSAHGVDCDPVYEVTRGNAVFFLTSGGEGPGALCRTLTEAGLGSLEAVVGENLGTEAETVTRGAVKEIAERRFAPLNVLLVAAAPTGSRRAPGIPDGEFLRAEIPMTKQEVRAAALAKLGVADTDICWDVGAGTGSIAVELALHSRAVWAVERNPAALALAQQNREKLRAWNLRLVEGRAPETLDGLPRPDAVFVGGSGGALREILAAVERANPAARICVSAIALETLRTAAETMAELGYEVEVTQIAVSRTRKAGGLHLLTAQNPVFLITGVRTCGG